MSTFYEEMQGVAADVLAEFRQGTVTLTRVTAGTVDPDAPWVPVAPGKAVVTLAATVRRVQQKYVDGTVVQVTDDQVTLAVPTIVPLMTDVVTIDGRARVTRNIRALPAAGTPVAYIIFVSG